MGTKKGRRNIRKNNGRTKKRAIRRPLSKRKEGKKTIRKHKGHKGKNTTRRKRLSGGVLGIKFHRTNNPNNFLRITPSKHTVYDFGVVNYNELHDDDKKIIKNFLDSPKSDQGKIYNDNNGNTPLHLAVIKKLPPEIIQLLASKGGESAKGMQNKYDGNTPLHLAVVKGSSPEIIELLASGPGGEKAKIMKNVDGNTPLHLAVKHNSSPEIITLLASGPEGESAKGMLNKYEGYTPLHLAVKHNSSPEIITLLASESAKGMQNKDGNTPLHLAVKHNSSPVIITLLASESAKGMQNNDGDTPYDIAIQNPPRSQEILKLLNPNASVEVDETSREIQPTNPETYGFDGDQLQLPHDDDEDLG